MVFSSSEFLLLFLPTLLGLYFLPFFKIKQKNTILLLASLFFYAYGEPICVFIMIIETYLVWILSTNFDFEYTYKIGKGYTRKNVRNNILLFVGLSIPILILVYYKYLNFFLVILFKAKINNSIHLPIGISFYTFQLISYLLDVYFEKVKAAKSFKSVLLYISFFPQLIAGPIVRYIDIEKSLYDRKNNIENLTNGLIRFSFGLAKKMLLANYFAVIVDNTFSLFPSNNISALSAWLAAISYTLQIYFDFSGYSDMAIGLGYIFGFRFSENFNYPYSANSITDFWKRWHISLSTWFRDYVYIPLGGNKVNKIRMIINMLIVWLLTGLWHGANFTFIVWGLVFFLVLVIEKILNLNYKNILISFVSHIFVILIVVLNWVIFRSENLTYALSFIKNMFTLNNNLFTDELFDLYFSHVKILLLLGILFSFPVYPSIKKLIFRKYENNNYNIIDCIIAIILFVISTILTISQSYNPFIYFDF